MQDTHKKTCVKVNAYVDERIAPVVEAMSKLPDIVTEYSCEDNRADASEGVPRAYITFNFRDERNNWKDLGNICNTLAKTIKEYRHAELHIRWKEGKPTGIFEFNAEDAYWLTMAMNGFCRDMDHIKCGN